MVDVDRGDAGVKRQTIGTGDTISVEYREFLAVLGRVRLGFGTGEQSTVVPLKNDDR